MKILSKHHIGNKTYGKVRVLFRIGDKNKTFEIKYVDLLIPVNRVTIKKNSTYVSNIKGYTGYSLYSTHLIGSTNFRICNDILNDKNEETSFYKVAKDIFSLDEIEEKEIELTTGDGKRDTVEWKGIPYAVSITIDDVRKLRKRKIENLI